MNSTELPVRPDCNAVLKGLKDFQRDTVDYVFQRLYLDSDFTRRFLIADEVGLGKTLVARGLIARVIDRLWDEVERIDIVYICSNVDIARQNINRLNVTEKEDFALASRITLLPVQLRDLKSNRLNFVSFTPGTSFDLKSSLGRADERALLYHLLDKAWDLGGRAAPFNVLQGWMDKVRFRNEVDKLRREDSIDEMLADAFVQTINRAVATEQQENQLDLRTRFDCLCERFNHKHDQHHLSDEDLANRSQFVGELRVLLAETCLEALEPDLIILDEFQRFKSLLDETSDMSRLAHGLFNYADEKSSARTILLSATPYKMYTLAQESSTENHYEDFLRTVSFLEASSSRTEEFKGLLENYRREIFRTSNGQNTQLIEIKLEIESRLRCVMVRTERLASSEDRDGMLTEVSCTTTKLEAQDLDSYIGLQRVAHVLDQHDTLEYWKSAPYLLNFMDDYDLKRELKHSIESADSKSELIDALTSNHGLLLSWQDFDKYKKLDPVNARMRGLTADLIESGAWQLLWVPPSLPYYQAQKPFDSEAIKRFTKRLVFSSWRVVPKALASLLSYEAERQILLSYEKTSQNTPDERKSIRPLLRFARTSEGRLTGMSVYGLLYPSTVLARECDPLIFALRCGSGEELPSLDDVLKMAQQRVGKLLSQIDFDTVQSGPEDETWYWAAPILLDIALDGDQTRKWFEEPNLAYRCSGEDSSDDESSLWAEHVQEAQKLVRGEFKLGRPPADLVDVISLMALAGPGTVILRALWRVSGGLDKSISDNSRFYAARVAWGMRSLFNLPESMSLIRGLAVDDDLPYWRKVLEYCIAGNIQSTLDEYSHFLREYLGLLDKPADDITVKISETMHWALTLRTTTTRVDDVQVNSDDNSVQLLGRSMRSHYAVRFGADSSDDIASSDRSEQVREAFNSPFWPFVLATTSVGQEGLDFHPYCHAIVHWNLPSNPVDLEQREGRIHRYKGHAVRKNLASHYTLKSLRDSTSDPWQTMFDLAKLKNAGRSSDIFPFWVYPIENGAKIERYVPALPLSRDRERMNMLRRSLAAYRMVFGQNRQEDLLAFLIDRVPEQEILKTVQLLRIDLEPPHQKLLPIVKMEV